MKRSPTFYICWFHSCFAWHQRSWGLSGYLELKKKKQTSRNITGHGTFKNITLDLKINEEILYTHPRKLTWNLKITHLKRKTIFQAFIFGFHVKFRGCTLTSKKSDFLTSSCCSCNFLTEQIHTNLCHPWDEDVYLQNDGFLWFSCR